MKEPQPPPPTPPIQLRCSKTEYFCLITAKIATPLLALVYLIFGLVDLADHNFHQLLFIPLVLFFLLTQSILAGIAIDYVKGGESRAQKSSP